MNTFISILGVSLRVDVVSLRCLQSSISVTLDLQVRIGDNDRTVRMVEIHHGARDQEIAQLDLEELSLLVQEKESAIDGLHDHY